jgi:hypothetical protein
MKLWPVNRPPRHHFALRFGTTGPANSTHSRTKLPVPPKRPRVQRVNPAPRRIVNLNLAYRISITLSDPKAFNHVVNVNIYLEYPAEPDQYENNVPASRLEHCRNNDTSLEFRLATN